MFGGVLCMVSSEKRGCQQKNRKGKIVKIDFFILFCVLDKYKFKFKFKGGYWEDMFSIEAMKLILKF